MNSPSTDSRSLRVIGYLFITLAAIIVVSIASTWYGFHKMKVGYELPPKEEQVRLADQFEQEFGWSGLPSATMERAWTEGFQDHISLYRIRLDRDQFASLRESVLKTTGENITSDDTDDLRLCPLGFATSHPQGPNKIPKWWEAPSLKNFDGVLWVFPGRGHGRFWFGYDIDRQILFLFHLNT